MNFLRRFEAIVEYCNKFQENIPISFILGFYVNAVVSRWWEQFNNIPWPSRLSLFVTSHIRGQDERSRMIRRTLMRYMSLGYVMTMSSISVPVKKRFPTTNHFIEAGVFACIQFCPWVCKWYLYITRSLHQTVIF